MGKIDHQFNSPLLIVYQMYKNQNILHFEWLFCYRFDFLLQDQL